MTEVTRPPATAGPISRNASRLYGGVGVGVGRGDRDAPGAGDDGVAGVGVGDASAGTGGAEGFDSGAGCASASAVPAQKKSAVRAARIGGRCTAASYAAARARPAL